MLAAAHEHKAMVEALLALGADVDARSGGGMSALLVAARHRQIETVEALLKAGADVDAQTTDGSTAVGLALARRDPLAVRLLLQGVGNPEDIGSCLRQAAANGYVNTVRLLIKAGADVNGFDDAEGKKKAIPTYEQIQNVHLHGDHFYRQRCEEARRYYDSKGNLNPFAVKEWADSLALFRAVRSGHAATVQALVEAGARVGRDYYGDCLILEGIGKDHVDIMESLLVCRYGAQWRDLNVKQDDMEAAIEMAFRTNNSALQRDLLGSRAGRAAAWNSATLLERAALANNPAMVRMLLDAGANPNQEVSGKRLLLELAATNGAGMEVMTMLIDAGASLDEAWRSTDTSPLVGAAGLNNSIDVVRLLLARLANVPNAKQHLHAALWCACCSASVRKQRVDVAQILLDAGAEFDGERGDIHALLYQVVRFDNSRQLPKDASEQEHISRGRAAIVQLLLKHKADVNHDPGKHSQYPSALFAAACTGQADMVRLLLEAGAKPDLRDKDGRTPLQHAIKYELKDIEALLRKHQPAWS